VTDANLLPIAIDQCWSRIGVNGDQSCPKLAEFVHCHNCPVFADAAQRFLDRPLPEGYLSETTSALAATSELRGSPKSLSVVVCEVEKQLLALESKAVVEVTEPRAVHRIGHRSGRVFLGIVNIHGQLELCASLKGLLQIASASAKAGPSLPPRMVLIELAGQRWVFPVDAVHGVQRLDDTDAFSVPATVQHNASSLVCKVLKWNEQRVGLLDLGKAVSSLDRSLQ
jgi:chemotaxis-related protein WspD